MKKIVLFIVAFIFNSALFATEYEGFSLSFDSREHLVIDGNFYFDLKIRSFDSILFTDGITLQLPENWSYSTSNQASNLFLGPNDSTTIRITINYPIDNLPFYLKYLGIGLSGHSSTRNETFNKTNTCGIYFTPYNSIEIWNMHDLINLPRKWLDPEIERGSTPTRIFIPRNILPVSDLIGKPENWLEINKSTLYDECREVEVSGLGYKILMSPIPLDSISYYEMIGDGPDSTSSGQKSLWKDFNGSVHGRLTASITNDLNEPITFPLSGIRVKLMEKDVAYSQNFGETYTDANGEFTIVYHKSQFAEGQCVELFLRFKSESVQYDIKARNWIGSLYEHDSGDWSAHDGEYNQNAGAINLVLNSGSDVRNEAFSAVHWAIKGIKYFDMFTTFNPLNLAIDIGRNSSYFNPPLRNIYLESNDGDRENTLYHELGHFIMVCLQDGHDTPAPGEDGTSHNWSEENTSKLAWSEGWANFVCMILDAYYYTEDNEYGRKGTGRENNPYFEELNVYSNIDNGFRSEYLIACALYDLWDGPGKGLPTVLRNKYTNIHGYNDSQQVGTSGYFWSLGSIDDVELYLSDLCKPLSDHPTGDGGYTADERVNNIHDYYRYLIENKSCEMKYNISRVFRENRVQWDISEYQNVWHATNFNPDIYGISETKDENPSNILYSNWTDTYWIRDYNKNNSNTYRYSDYSFIEDKINDDLYIGIWDDLRNTYKYTEFYLNDQVRTHLGQSSLVNGFVETCGPITINVFYGKLEIGGSNTTSTLIMHPGSELNIGVNGQLVINNNSSVVIECGAHFIVDNQSEILLSGSGSQLIVYGINFENNSNIYNFSGEGSITVYYSPTVLLPNYPDNNYTVEGNALTKIEAKQNVILLPGFHAKYGSHFIASVNPNIIDCDVSTKIMNNDNSNHREIVDEDNSMHKPSVVLSDDTLVNISTNSPNETSLLHLYPNPSQSMLSIEYQITTNEPTSLFISNQTGYRLIDVFSRESIIPGAYSKTIDISELPSGHYYLSIETSKFIKTKSFIKIK